MVKRPLHPDSKDLSVMSPCCLHPASSGAGPPVEEQHPPFPGKGKKNGSHLCSSFHHARWRIRCLTKRPQRYLLVC